MFKVSIAHFEQMQHNNQQKTLYNTTPLGNVPTFNKYFPTEYGRFSSQHCFIVYGITHFKDKPKLIFQGRRHSKVRGDGGREKKGEKRKKRESLKAKTIKRFKGCHQGQYVTVLAILEHQCYCFSHSCQAFFQSSITPLL